MQFLNGMSQISEKLSTQEQPLVSTSNASSESGSHNASDKLNNIGNAAFSDLCLSSHEALEQCQRRRCTGPCGKQRRYICSECVVPLIDPLSAVPKVKLPLRVHVLQAGSERPQQSTAQHIPLLAPEDATVWRPFPDCAPAFQAAVVDPAPSGSIALLYPSDGAFSPKDAAAEMPELQHLIVIDATWTKSALLVNESLLNDLPKVSLSSGTSSRFWRYPPLRGEHSQYFNPEKVPSLLSTVESVHRFCDAFGRAKGLPTGICDDLLWLFAFIHHRVRNVYDSAPEKRQRILRKSKGLMDQF